MPIQYTIPFSSKSCWCLKVKLWPSLSFLTKMNEDLSKSYHCLATWGKWWDKVMTFSQMSVGIQLSKYGIIEEINTKKAFLPSWADTAPVTQQWPAAPSLAFYQFGQSGPFHLEHAPSGSVTSLSVSNTTEKDFNDISPFIMKDVTVSYSPN